MKKPKSVTDVIRRAGEATDGHLSVIRDGRLDLLFGRLTLFGVLTSAGILAVLGTLRHWF